MRLAIISDIHANLEALTAVLQRIDRERIDEIVCLGDIVGYGPDPGACIDLVRARCSTVVLGNHDEWAITPPPYETVPEAIWQSIVWTAPRISEDHRAYLSTLPLVAHGENLMYVHSAPGHPHRWDYIVDEAGAARNFIAVQGGVCFVGHSHIPGIYPSEDHVMAAKRCIVNVGSVGQPRDHDISACFAIHDTARIGEGCTLIARVPYDHSVTRSKIEATDLPHYFSYRLSVGR
jgi:predicted phosphodiesterase